jgi:hypothetical protein
VARTIYLGSAPTTTAANRGLEDRRVKLGCVMPGESPAIFGDALRRLAASATYLYQDGPRYWYSTQPTVTKLAEDKAEQLKRDPDAVVQEIEKRVRADLRNIGDFARVHPFPQSSADVQDDLDARLVVLSTDHPYSREEGSTAEIAAKAILEARGNAPRLYQNTLVFLAVDKTKLQDLDEAVRKYLAWESILAEKVQLDLSPHQVRQAETQKTSADSAVSARLPEAYQWLLVPVQNSPQTAVEWQAYRLAGQDGLAVRTSKRLRNEELLLTGFAPTRLRMELDRIPLWRGEHVFIKQLIEDFARYLYLPRLKQPAVLTQAIQDGFKLLTWRQDSFAFADSYDEAADRYRGLVFGQIVNVTPEANAGLLVKPDIACVQVEAEQAGAGTSTLTEGESIPSQGTEDARLTEARIGDRRPQPVRNKPTRYHGTVALDANRVGRDAGRIADEVISHLSGLVGSTVKVTLEIEAVIPDGTSDEVVRIVTENGRTLRFEHQGFED